MKKIIDGMLYDTDIAEHLGSYSELAGDDDFSCQEELYRTKNGRYFLYRTGGIYYPYAREPFMTLTGSQARSWAESKLTAEEYCWVFGFPTEG